MDDISEPRLDESLLAVLRADDEYAAALREQLYALGSTLARSKYAKDRPPRIVEAWRALDTLLDRARVDEQPEPAPEPVETGEPEPPARTSLADDLDAMWERLRDDEPTGAYARRMDEKAAGGDPVEDRWQRIHLLCLRLPEETARAVRQEARDVAARHVEIPAGADELLPGLDGPGGIDGDWKGPDPEARFAALQPIARRLAWLAENDPAVFILHAELQYDPARVERPDPQEAQLYRRTIGSKMDRLADAEQGSEAEFDALIGLDEMFRGLVPLPLPQEGSWWTRSLREVREALIDGRPEAAKYSLLGSRSSFLAFKERLHKTQNIAAGPDWLSPPVRGHDQIVWILRIPWGITGDRVGRVIYLPS